MKIFFGQIYIEPGVEFAFSHHFQKKFSREISALVKASESYIERFGRDFELMFRISAKNNIKENDIRGPAVFKKTKDVEYTIFLPFDVISQKADVPRAALIYLTKGICKVFDSLEIDTAKICERQKSLIDSICADPKMFNNDDD